MMNKGKLGLVGAAAVVALILVIALATGVLAQGMGLGQGGFGMMGSGQSWGPAMMQGSGIAPTTSFTPTQVGCGGFAPGMMGAWGGHGGYSRGMGMMGGQGMMGGVNGTCPLLSGDDGEPGVTPGSTPKRLSDAEVKKAVNDYLAQNYNNPDLQTVELMAFEKNYYAQVAEKSTGVNAFELLIDPYTGVVWPEYGPNMMWNTQYGHMSGMGGMMMQGWGGKGIGQPTAEMPVGLDQARKNAQAYLDARKSGLTIEDGTDVFYGYYTVHTLDKDGNTVGMLSVNGYTGRVWYHTWHGKFFGMVEGA